MSDADTPLTTGFELQDALAAAGGDPVGDALAELDIESLRALLRSGHEIGQVRKFMKDHGVPARFPDPAAVRRLLPRIRDDRPYRRRKTVRWLTFDLSNRTHHALVSAVGPPAAWEHHTTIDLGNLIDEFGTAAVRLAVLGDWGSERCDLNLAMLIVEGRAVADRWRPHLDRLLPIAQRLVDDFEEAHHDLDVALDDAIDEPVDDDLGTRSYAEARAGEAEPVDVFGGNGFDETAAPYTVAPPVQSPVEEPALEQPDEPAIREVAEVATGPDPFEQAQQKALQALEVLEAATVTFRGAVEVVRRLSGGPAARLADALPAAPGAVKADDLHALRVFAAGAGNTGDPEQLEFLRALAELADLAGAGADDDTLMAAEDAVLAFPEAANFRGVVFAASRARLRVGERHTIDERLLPWLHADADTSSLEHRHAPSIADSSVDLLDVPVTGYPTAATSLPSTHDSAVTTDSATPESAAVTPESAAVADVPATPESAAVADAPATPESAAVADAPATPESAAVADAPATPESAAVADAPATVPVVATTIPSEPVEPEAGSGMHTSDPSRGDLSGGEDAQSDTPAADQKDNRAAGAPLTGPATATAAGVDTSDGPGLVPTPAVELVVGTVSGPETLALRAGLKPVSIGEEAETRSANEARAPVASKAADNRDEVADAALSALLGTGQWGLASWLARAGGDAARAEALQAIAYSDGARSASGPLAVALTDTLDALNPRRLGGDRAIQLLAVAAATRAALVAPFSGVTTSLGQLARSFDTDAPAIAAVADTAVDAAIRGVAFTGDIIASLGGAAATDARIVEIRTAADAMLSRTGRTGFARGDNIWSEWVAAGGPIHDLLGPVVANNTARIAAVRAAVFEYSKDSVASQRLRDSDDHYRGPGKPRVEGPARTTLLSRLRDAVKIAGEWANVVEATGAAHTSDHEAVVATRVRGILRGRRPAIEAILKDWAAGPDVVLAGAAVGAQRLYTATFDLVEGQVLAGDERGATELLNVDLLRGGIAVAADLQPMDPDGVTVDAVIEASNRSWDDAFAARCAAGDHVGTGAIVKVVAAADAGRGAELASQRAVALAEDRDRVAQRALQLSAVLEAARRSGRLDEDTAAEASSRVATATDTLRADLDSVRIELDEVETALESAATAAVDAFRDRLAELGNVPAVAEAHVRFAQLLDERDLATAEELLLQLQDGVTQASEHRPDVDFAAFYPAVVDHLHSGITDELIDKARRREVDGPLDFSGLSPEMAETAADALKGWRAVSSAERRARKTEGLVLALRVLGLEFRTEKAPGLPASNDRSWVDLTGVQRVPQTLVPAFGTYAGESQRLLLVWKQPNESLLEWVEQDHSEQPVIVLYFGTMPADVRGRIANQLRSRHRTVVVVDDAVLAWAASLGRQTFEVTMRATLPFSAVNPYQPGIAGAVPEEMFFGRIAERSAVMNDTGTSLIYGGRRLGKSALLRAAERRFGGIHGQVALYIDLSPAAIRSTQRPEAVWDLIAARLVDVGVAERPSTKRAAPDPFLRTERVVRSYLAAADNRKMLLLLDECDDFFDVDAQGDFAQTRRLKDLMESTGRRFKVVFAGLHQVARFASYPNQPLAHLGKPLAIGPLAPQYAHNLIAKPFTALGWRFASEDLINRVLNYCNYTPILLQEFGQTLIAHLHVRRIGPGEPPAMITAADIDAVLSSGSLADAIRSRFDLTLSLDPRYKMITYVLALETHAGGRATASAAMTTAALRDECRDWWPDGFADVHDDEFRALLDELVALGVLSADRGAWRMRSPNVLRLLGTRQSIEAGLMELVRENPAPGGFFSAEAHRLVELTADADSGQRVRSPFTEQQLADAIGEGRNQLRIVVATAATGADRVGAVLGVAGGLTGRWDLVVPSRPAVFEHAVVEGPARSHRVVFADLRGVAGDAIRRAVAACAKHPSQPKATCATVLLVAPDQLPVVEDALAGLGVEDAAVMAMRRYSSAALRAWAVEVESGFTDDDARRILADVTGCWPILVEEAEAEARSSNARQAVELLDAGLAARSGWLLEAVGVAEGPLGDAWSEVVELLGADGRAPVDTVGELVGESGEGHALVRALIAAGVLVTDGDELHVEPVAAAAWGHLRGEDIPTPGFGAVSQE
jgi:hypothetical protein